MSSSGSSPLHSPEVAAVSVPASNPVGLFYAWWRGDELPVLPPVANLAVVAADTALLAASFPALNPDEQDRRQRAGHQPYLARVSGQPVAYGWSAHRTAEIGELGVTLQLADGERYLWDFVTLPDWRGQGIYAGMLHAILAAEPNAERFWIGHDFDNRASARGILKAGFQPVNALFLTSNGAPVLFAYPETGVSPPVLERAGAAAALLGLPLVGQLAAPPS